MSPGLPGRGPDARAVLQRLEGTPQDFKAWTTQVGPDESLRQLSDAIRDLMRIEGPLALLPWAEKIHALYSESPS